MCSMDKCSSSKNGFKNDNNNNKQEQPNKQKGLTLLNNRCASNLFICDLQRQVIIRVNKKEFNDKNGFVTVIDDFKVKVINGNRKLMSEYISLVKGFSVYEAEGLWGSVNFLYETTKSITTISQKILSSETSVESNALLLDLMSLIMQHTTTTFNNWTPTYLIGFMARIYSLFIRVKNTMQNLVSESLDSTLLLAGAIGLPENFFSVLKRLSTMTNKRIGDHPGLFLEGIQCISSFLAKLISKLTWLPEDVRKFLMRIFSYGDFQMKIMELETILEKWQKNKRELSNVNFRQRIFEGKKILDDLPDLTERLRVAVNFKNFYNDYSRMVNSAKAYEKCSRQEPLLIVLEGPPGVRKTVTLLKVLKLLNMSTYTHIVKSTMDGKDFYDGYNNEDVFIMDDVGQQGVSQWRTIINMVSSVKMPLECATVELKDTKYFDSKVIIVTTNCFSGLNGLTKADGISDVKALWRRAQVFHFSDMSTITYKRFDVARDQWTSRPQFSSVHMKTFRGTGIQLAAYITAFIKRGVAYFESLEVDIDLTSSEVEAAQDLVEEMFDVYYDLPNSESWMSTAFNINSKAESLKRYIEDMFSMFADALKDIGSFSVGVVKETLLQTFVRDSQGNYTGQQVTNTALLGALTVYCSYHAYMAFAQYVDVGRKEETNADIIQVWQEQLKTKGKQVKIDSSKVYISESTAGTLVESIRKNVKLVKILLKNDTFEVSHCLVSGSMVILPAHAIYESTNTLLLYNDQNDFIMENRALDHCSFEVVMEDRINDVAVLRLPLLNMTPYKNIADYFKFMNRVAKNPYFVWSGEPVKLEGTVLKSPENPRYITRFGPVMVEEPLCYDMTSKGFCGAIIADENAGILGFHVAGDGVSRGIAKIFSQSLCAKIHEKLKEPYTVVEKEVLPPPNNQFGGMVIKSDIVSDGPKHTHLRQSMLADMHEGTKEPADLRSLGPHTVKQRAYRMHKIVKTIPQDELNYMEKFLNFIIPNYTPVTEYEVIKGNEFLSPMNKDSVSGKDFPYDKSEYIDFEKGECKEEFAKDLNEFREQCQYRYPDKITQHHTVKDELRVKEKVKKPRTFGVDSFATQFELKRLLGGLMVQLRQARWKNGLAIGLNPYKDWKTLYEILEQCLLLWDGDVGEYDASVSPQIQNLVNKVLDRKFVGTQYDRNILNRLLCLVIQSWVVAGNKKLFKTHGVLSGMWVTNLFDSIYNRCYSAGWYRRNKYSKYKKEFPITRFLEEVIDFVQGDDKICGSKADTDVLNAMTMRDYFVDCGMTFTDGEKGEITEPGKSLFDCVFLKRKFRFHDELGEIVGPLSLETITNSIRWYKDDNEEEVIMKDKYHVYQRELYLHAQEGLKMIADSQKFIRSRGINLPPLDLDYIRKTYKDDPDYWYSYVTRVNDKNFYY